MILSHRFLLNVLKLEARLNEENGRQVIVMS